MTPPDVTDPDQAYCDFVAACTDSATALDTPVDMPADLLRARDLLRAVRAAAPPARWSRPAAGSARTSLPS